MKKIAAALLAALMLLAFAAAEPLAGGWCVAEDAGITEELREVFDRAMEGLVGVDYEPIAYLGYQVVAGRNHCFLCRAAVVYPGAVPYCALVYIYEGFGNPPEILRIVDLDIGALAQGEEN